MAHAPSLSVEALPAVTVPLSFFENGAKFSELVGVELNKFLVTFNHCVRSSSLPCNGERNYFLLEPSFLLTPPRPLVTLHREIVLLTPGNPHLRGRHLPAHAHVNPRVRVGEAVGHYDVIQPPAPVPRRVSGEGHGRVGHRLHAARHYHILMAAHQRLSRHHNRFCSTRANLVDRCARYAVW